MPGTEGCCHTGVQHMQLRLCKNKRSPLEIATGSLDPLTVKPSDLVVSCIEAQAPADILAGNHLPPVR